MNNDAQFARFVSIDLASRVGAGVSLSTYQLGLENGFGGFDYPAEGDLATLIDALFWLPGNPYDASVAEGRSELVAYLTDRATVCPNEVFVLGGWSQGAQVVGEGLLGLARAVRDRVAYVALFGDPKLETGNFQPVGLPFPRSPDFPTACFFGEKPWIRGSAPCWISGGQLGPRDPYVPADIELRVGSWCREFDGVCTGSLADLVTSFLPPNDGVHRKYFGADSDSAVAAREAALALQLFLPAQAASFDVSWFQFVSGATGADLAFVFDTTGSMSDAIADAKAQATELAQAWLDFYPNGRVGLVQYRDQGDDFVSQVELELTDNVTDFQAALDALVAEGGGDAPEAMLSGLMTALDGLTWRDGALKTAVVIGDAPGKDPEPVTGFTRDQVSGHALEIDPVAIYGVDVTDDPETSEFMAPMATASAGQVFVLQPGQSLAEALFEVIEVVSLSPVATLNGPYVAETGTAITFRTDGSFDADAELVSYEWDFNGDGTVDQTTSLPDVVHTYPGAFQGSAAVRVVSSDGGSALATAQVTVDSVGLGNLLPAAPLSVAASITGPGEATVTWTPAANDLADGYKVFLADGSLVRLTLDSDPNSVVLSGIDFSEPVVFYVAASNAYGNSAPVASPPVGGPAPITTTRVSESSTHGQGNGASDKAFLSADGRFATFRSGASTLVTNDTNNANDVFVKDRLTNAAILASSTSSGVVGNARSDDGSISADGRYVAFRSQASNLVTNDTNGTAWDTFVKDLQTGAVGRVSVSSSGAQANGASFYPVLSADGRYVAFRSDATNLITGDTNGVGDIYLRDRQTSTTTRISVATGGGQSNGKSDRPTISNDGRYILYESDATNLVTGDTNGVTDVFRYDRTTGTTIRVSVTSSGVQGNGISDDAAISGDGSTVTFESSASNLVTGDTNGKGDVFVRTIATSVTIRGSVTSSGAQANKDSSDPSLSYDGTILGFASNATNLITGDTNSKSDVFIRDLTAGTNTRFSIATDGTPGNGTSQDPWLSSNGGTVAFESVASNLVSGDTNATSDIFVRGPAMGG